MVPTVTPVMAPAAAVSGAWPFFTSHQARDRPMASLHNASMICDTEVGVMFRCPWV